MAMPEPRPSVDPAVLGDRAVTLCQDLLRFDTTNPPGNERAAAEYLADALAPSGVEIHMLARAPERMNMVARLRGDGSKPPLLLCAHLDVVPADPSRWKHPPFGGEIHDGYLWGRGAVDMKNMAAMSAAVIEALARGGERLSRDVIFAAVADEEAGCDFGSRFLVDEHADRVRAETMLGEVGAFSMRMMGRTFYPIQVAEKGIAWARATAHGHPGHGSMPDPSSAVAQLAEAITRLAGRPLPLHPTATVTAFLETLATHLPRALAIVLPRLADPIVGSWLLQHALRDRDQQRQFIAMLSNTASPNILRAGDKINVIPATASVDLDIRTLPGQSAADAIREVQDRMGAGISVELLKSHPATLSDPSHPLVAHLSATLRRHDPDGIPLPYMIPGFTDASSFSRLGTQCYGFSPLRFDVGDPTAFGRLFHGDDERVPLSGIKWGTAVLYDAVRTWCTG